MAISTYPWGDKLLSHYGFFLLSKGWVGWNHMRQMKPIKRVFSLCKIFIKMIIQFKRHSLRR